MLDWKSCIPELDDKPRTPNCIPDTNALSLSVENSFGMLTEISQTLSAWFNTYSPYCLKNDWRSQSRNSKRKSDKKEIPLIHDLKTENEVTRHGNIIRTSRERNRVQQNRNYIFFFFKRRLRSAKWYGLCVISDLWVSVCQEHPPSYAP